MEMECVILADPRIENNRGSDTATTLDHSTYYCLSDYLTRIPAHFP